MSRSVIGLSVLLTSCAYVSRDEYLAYWDADGDGWPLEDDCAPDDPDAYPFAPDPRGDGCDSDCGEEPDADGDDWPDAADCGSDDPDVHPCASGEIAGDDRDLDCDGADGRREDLCSGADPDFPDEGPRSCAP